MNPWETVAYALIGKPDAAPHPRGTVKALQTLAHVADDASRVYEAADLLGIEIATRSVDTTPGGLSGHGKGTR